MGEGEWAREALVRDVPGPLGVEGRIPCNVGEDELGVESGFCTVDWCLSWVIIFIE